MLAGVSCGVVDMPSDLGPRCCPLVVKVPAQTRPRNSLPIHTRVKGSLTALSSVPTPARRDLSFFAGGLYR